MRLRLMLLAGILILAGCNLANDAPTPSAPNPEPPATATTVATYPACNTPDIAPAPVLRIEPDQAVQPGCYQFAHGESFTVRWENPPDDIQMIEFFRNCTDPSAPMMMCTDRAVDDTPADGFSVTFTMPDTFNEVIITAIAYGTGQGSAVDSGGILVFTGD